MPAKSSCSSTCKSCGGKIKALDVKKMKKIKGGAACGCGGMPQDPVTSKTRIASKLAR